MFASHMTISIRAVVMNTLSGSGKLNPADGIRSTRVFYVINILVQDLAIAIRLFSR